MKLVHSHSLVLATAIVGTSALATQMKTMQSGMAMMQMMRARLPAEPAK